VECVQGIPLSLLIQAQEAYQAEERAAGRHGFDGINPSITFGKLKLTPTILPDYPLNILKEGKQRKVPLLIGATKQDGEFSLGLIFSNFLLPNGLLTNSSFLSKRLVSNMLSSVGYNPSEKGSVEGFKAAYLGKCSDSGNFMEMLPGLTDISTVLFFKAAALEVAELHSEQSPTYLYSFDFKGTRTQHNKRLPFPGGVAHSDDTIYLFPIQDFEFNLDERKVSDLMIDFWANFAKTGSPGFSKSSNISWPRFDSAQKYLILDKDPVVHNDYKGKWIQASRYAFGNSSCYN